jgi:sugar diacid utilization regulator
MDDPLSNDVLVEIAAAGSADSGGLPADLLGDFLMALAHAVARGEPMSSRELRTYRAMGDAAARQGIPLRALLDLYLSSAWRMWRHLPSVQAAATDPARVVVAGEIMLQGLDGIVATLAEGFQLAQRALVRAQVSARREFIDDLLSGAADVMSLLRRAGGFGIDLSAPYAVAVIRAEARFNDDSPIAATLERTVQGRKGDAQALVASQDGRLVVIFQAPDRAAIAEVMAQVSDVLGPQPDESERVELRRASVGAWQVGVGRAGVGADGVLASYREARDTLAMASRLGLTNPIVHGRDLLVYQVLLRDRPALVDLVDSTLSPLLTARGGAQPLLDTLAAYFDSGANSAQTARDLHLSVRAVTYRLERVLELTGLDPTESQARFTLHLAVVGAQLLNWPAATSD